MEQSDANDAEGAPLITPMLGLGTRQFEFGRFIILSIIIWVMVMVAKIYFGINSTRSTRDEEGVSCHNVGSNYQGEAHRQSVWFRGGRRLLRRFRPNFLLLLVASTLLVLVTFQNPGSWTKEKRLRKNDGENLPRLAYTRRTTKCHFPKLDPFSPQIMSMIDKKLFQSNHSCHDDNFKVIFKDVAFHVEKGHILVRDVNLPEDVTCCFQNVKRHEDEEILIDEKCKKIDTFKQRVTIQIPSELILVSCKNSKNQSYYKDAFQLFPVKSEVERRIKKWLDVHKTKVDERLSVIVLGIDSTTQLHFERSMPQSKIYLEKTLNALKISGYNKVGQHTYPNLMPLFAGMTANELTKFCVRKLDERQEYRVDNKKCPFIWNAFASSGYRTSYAEDDLRVVLFNYYFRNAFADAPPTDYYNRPYSILFEKTLGFHKKYCYGPRLQFEALLDNVRSMADTFRERERPYLNVVWSTKLTHDDMNRTKWGDKPLLKLLQYLNGNGHLNHTALFLVGDHGIHANQINEQVMLENRMPLAYIVLPPWFPQRYSRAYKNLRWNAENELASHFDMHKTILNILDLKSVDNTLGSGAFRRYRYFDPKNGVMMKRGQSLFEISAQPHGRNCESAGIPYIWCVCPRRVPLRNDSSLSILAADAVVSGVNQKIHPACGKLRLRYIYSATVMVYEHVWRKPDCRRIIRNTSLEEDFHGTHSTTTKLCNDRLVINVKIVEAGSGQIFNAVAVREANGKISFLMEDQSFSVEGLDSKYHCANFYLHNFPLYGKPESPLRNNLQYLRSD